MGFTFPLKDCVSSTSPRSSSPLFLAPIYCSADSYYTSNTALHYKTQQQYSSLFWSLLCVQKPHSANSVQVTQPAARTRQQNSLPYTVQPMAPSALQNYQPQNLCNEKNYPETSSEVSVPQLRHVRISILIGGLVLGLVFILVFFCLFQEREQCYFKSTDCRRMVEM